MPEKAEFGPDEHEALLKYLGVMHNEDRAQTLERLRAALGASPKKMAAVPEKRRRIGSRRG